MHRVDMTLTDERHIAHKRLVFHPVHAPLHLTQSLFHKQLELLCSLKEKRNYYITYMPILEQMLVSVVTVAFV